MLSGNFPMMNDEDQNQGGGGFLNWIRSPAGRSMLYGAGVGLNEKLNNPNANLLSTAMTAAQTMQKDLNEQQAYKNLKGMMANMSPKEQAIMQFAIQTRNPSLITSLVKSTNPSQTSAMKNAEALGYKPGTREYQDYIKASTIEKGGGVNVQESRALVDDIARANPTWPREKVEQAATLGLAGYSTFDNGEKINFGLGADLVKKIQNRNSTAKMKEQAANADILAADVNDIDITPVAKFAGLYGQKDYIKYQTAMALGEPVPDEFRAYLHFKDVVTNLNMDALRQSFGTSVVPEYVTKTLGAAANPNSKFWYDPQQVMYSWNKTVAWINENARKRGIKATQGATANVKSNNQNNSNMVTIRNNKTGEIKTVSREEAQRMGAI